MDTIGPDLETNTEEDEAEKGKGKVEFEEENEVTTEKMKNKAKETEEEYAGSPTQIFVHSIDESKNTFITKLRKYHTNQFLN